MLLGDNDDPAFFACYSHSSDDSHAAKISALATKKECTLHESGSARLLAGQQCDPAHPGLQGHHGAVSGGCSGEANTSIGTLSSNPTLHPFLSTHHSTGIQCISIPLLSPETQQTHVTAHSRPARNNGEASVSICISPLQPGRSNFSTRPFHFLSFQSLQLQPEQPAACWSRSLHRRLHSSL